MKKLSVVTGATGGMGYACAKIAGEKTAVLIGDVNQEKIDSAVEDLKALGVDACGMVCDITDKEQVKAFAAKAASLGQIVALYNVAGLSSTQVKTVGPIMNVNAFGTLNMIKEFSKVMEGGCIMNVASSTAYWLPADRLPTKIFDLALTDEEAFREGMSSLAANTGIEYAISKTFVKYITAKMAYQLGREKGIRIVSASPGVIDTAMTQNKESDRGKSSAMSFCALGRLGRPEELAYSFVALADERNSYVTGIDLLVDGGCGAEGYNGTNVRGQESGVSIEDVADSQTGQK